MLTEPEFAGPLTVMQRDRNTLSVVLRMAWDNATLQTLTKNSPGAPRVATSPSRPTLTRRDS